jgi:ABC-type amino acid transport system permease subunit
MVTVQELKQKAQAKADTSGKTFYVITVMGMYYIVSTLSSEYYIVSTHNPR